MADNDRHNFAAVTPHAVQIDGKSSHNLNDPHGTRQGMTPEYNLQLISGARVRAPRAG